MNEQTGGYPPKPIVEEPRQSPLIRSMISLFVYGLLFYLLFDHNIGYIAAILVVLLIHEGGHFLFMKLFNYSNVKIFIVPLLGAFTSGRKQQVSQWQLSLIILAGPLPGIIIGSALLLANPEPSNENLRMLANTFLVINLLNCLPFHPLDGGRLIETLFFRENYLIRMIFGIISLIALVLLALLIGSPLLLIIPALIGLEIFNESKLNRIREYLRNERINYFTDYENLPDRDYWLIRDCLIFSFPKKFGMLTPGQYDYAIIEPLIVKQVAAVLQVSLIPDLKGLRKIGVLIFYLASIGVALGVIISAAM